MILPAPHTSSQGIPSRSAIARASADRHLRMHLDARVLTDQVGHRHPPPRRLQIDLTVADRDDGAAGCLCHGRDHDRLGQLHHVVVVAERLVGLEQRELGVVPRVEALVAKHATDLEHAIHAADDQALERQLQRDPQRHLDVQRVVVGDERPRRRAARPGRAGPGSPPPESPGRSARGGRHRSPSSGSQTSAASARGAPDPDTAGDIEPRDRRAHGGCWGTRAGSWTAVRTPPGGPTARRGWS